jgi:hypothetical protein
MFRNEFSDCEEAYGNDLIADQMICAGEAGKDSCQVFTRFCWIVNPVFSFQSKSQNSELFYQEIKIL